MTTDSTSPRAFIVEPPRTDMDLSGVTEFGKMEVIFAPPQRRGVGTAPMRREFRPSVFDAESFGRKMLEELAARGYDPQRDYFVLTGSTLAVSIAFAALAVQYGAFKTLAYNSAMERYVEKDFDAKNVALAATH